MLSAARVAAYVLIFGITSLGWLMLGGTMSTRLYGQNDKLGGEVQALWGRPHQQQAPQLRFSWETQREVVSHETVGRHEKRVTQVVTDRHDRNVMPTSSSLAVDLGLDERLKGLLWYSLYNVSFDGHWTYVHRDPYAGVLSVAFQFPDADGLYDGFALVVDGKDRSAQLRPHDGRVETEVPVQPGQSVDLHIAYKSRGKDAWSYTPTQGVDTLDNFRLQMRTDFEGIDFPALSLSPSTRVRKDGGWDLAWEFSRAVTGRSIGMNMPRHLQPGELAATLSFSAPISLFFFLLMMWVLAVLRGIDLHPINAVFLSGAFFAFHLLFGYSVDHLSVVAAFVLASAVSVALVVSYMRLVVGPRFALLEAGVAQLVYLVGFSLAHFFEGFTGLTVTVLAVVTLFLLMQLTGRIRWSDLAAGKKPQAQEPPMPPARPEEPATSAAPMRA